MNFAIIGVGGYIAPRHLRAIHDTGHHLVAALDKNDSVGIMDQYALDIDFFTEPERFDRHLERLRQGPEDRRVHWVSICSPNYLHDAHCRMAMRVGADVICEKPLVLNPWNLDALQEIEVETGCKINTILQLRVHPALIELRERLMQQPAGTVHQVDLSYITARGRWYDYSWKGDIHKSGGVATNIGIHFFDLLIWLFGSVRKSRVYLADEKRQAGYIELERAQVRWLLSIDGRDLPFTPEPGKLTTYRSITVDGEEIEFTGGFTDLHTLVYERTLAGQGFGIEEIRPATTLVHDIRHATLSEPDEMLHPLLQTAGQS